MITRRIFIGTLTGGLLAAPFAAKAQQIRDYERRLALGYESFKSKVRPVVWQAGQVLSAHRRCVNGTTRAWEPGIGSCGVPRPSTADYVMETGAPRGATAAGGG